MHNIILYSSMFSLGLISFITCFAAEFKRIKEEDVQWDMERNCYVPESHAFGLGSVAVLCFCLAQIVGNIVVFRNHRTRFKGGDCYKSALLVVMLLLSWSNFVVVVLMLSTAISISRAQPYGEGWFDKDCYVVKDGVFAASGCLAILGLGALTILATRFKINKQQQLVQFVIKDQKNMSETIIIHLVEEASPSNISKHR